MVRMWMVNPAILCRSHLLGEHNELHMLTGSLRKKHSISGYIENNCVEVHSIEERHDQVAKEMGERGYTHKSPIEVPDVSYLPLSERLYQIDRSKSFMLLISRCPECKKLYSNFIRNVE
jgi:hypothetical protein